MKTPIYADLDQIVFEGRSQDYGAYEMRAKYNRVLTRATLIAFLLFIAVTGLPKMIDWITPRAMVIAAPEPAYVDVIPDIPLEEKKLEDEPHDFPELAAPAIDIRSIAVVIPTPTPDEQVREEAVIAEMSELDSAVVGLATKDGAIGVDYSWEGIPTGPGGGGADETALLETDEKDPTSTEFILLEKEPQPVNMDELKAMIGYPPMALEAAIQGKVMLRVMIDKNGDYVKHTVFKDPHPILTKAVTDKISHLKMTPGIQAGRPIKVWVTVPFDFHLLN